MSTVTYSGIRGDHDSVAGGQQSRCTYRFADWNAEVEMIWQLIGGAMQSGRVPTPWPACVDSSSE